MINSAKADISNIKKGPTWPFGGLREKAEATTKSDLGLPSAEQRREVDASCIRGGGDRRGRPLPQK
jgi:hypothetical protein